MSIAANANADRIELDITQLANGTYLLVAKNAGGQRAGYGGERGALRQMGLVPS